MACLIQDLMCDFSPKKKKIKKCFSLKAISSFTLKKSIFEKKISGRFVRIVFSRMTFCQKQPIKCLLKDFSSLITTRFLSQFDLIELVPASQYNFDLLTKSQLITELVNMIDSAMYYENYVTGDYGGSIQPNYLSYLDIWTEEETATNRYEVEEAAAESSSEEVEVEADCNTSTSSEINLFLPD